MRLTIPDKKLLKKTGDVDYYDWNYKFPIKIITKYRFRRIVQLLRNHKYPVLLEAGFGSGVFIPELTKYCTKFYGCDIHHKFDHIHEICEQYNITDYELSSQSIEETNYPDEFFDAIVAVSVLEFVKDHQKTIHEIKRILKKGGVFITICPMENKILDFFLSLYTTKSPKEEFGNSRQKITTLLEQNFTVIKKGYMIPIIGKFFPVYTHYKLMKN